MLRALIEELTDLVVAPPWDDFEKLVRLLDSQEGTVALDCLSPEELRRFQSLRLTVHRAATMEPEAMVAHVAAEWRGGAEQAVRKLPVGAEAAVVVRSLMRSIDPLAGA